MNIRPWKVAVAFGLPWSICMIVFGTALNREVSAIVVGASVVSGAFAGWVFSLLIEYSVTKLYNSIVVETASSEKLIKQGGANHYIGKEAVGGKLVLTDKQLIFKSHLMDLEKHQSAFFLNNIIKIVPFRNFTFIKSGLAIELDNHEKHRFVVDDPAAWIHLLKDQQHDSAIRRKKNIF